MKPSEPTKTGRPKTLPLWYLQAKEELDACGEPVYTDDAKHLCIAAEEDFEAAIPMILGELAANRSTNRRESCVLLLDCYADPRHAGQVLDALRHERLCADQAAPYLYVNCLLTFGDAVLAPMLALWQGSGSDSYSRSVACEFLTRFLSRPLARELP